MCLWLEFSWVQNPPSRFRPPFKGDGRAPQVRCRGMLQLQRSSSINTLLTRFARSSSLEGRTGGMQGVWPFTSWIEVSRRTEDGESDPSSKFRRLLSTP